MTQSKNTCLRPGEVIMLSAFTNHFKTSSSCRAFGENEMRREGFIARTEAWPITFIKDIIQKLKDSSYTKEQIEIGVKNLKEISEIYNTLSKKFSLETTENQHHSKGVVVQVSEVPEDGFEPVTITLTSDLEEFLKENPGTLKQNGFFPTGFKDFDCAIGTDRYLTPLVFIHSNLDRNIPIGFGLCKELLEESGDRVYPEVLIPSRPNTTLNFGNMAWAPKLVTVKGLFALRAAALVKYRRIRAKRLRKAKQRRK